MWNIRGLVSSGKYTRAIVPEHPGCTWNGYVLEHRIVMENYLGRLLTSDELIHHVNGDPKDNRLENLEIHSRQSHAALHGGKRGTRMVLLQCPLCDTVFTRRHGVTHLVQSRGMKYTTCSRGCGHKMASKRDRGQFDSVMLDKISNCVLDADVRV